MFGERWDMKLYLCQCEKIYIRQRSTETKNGCCVGVVGGIKEETYY